MPKFDKTTPSVYFEDRTGSPSAAAIKARLGQLFEFLMRPQDSQKSFQDPRINRERHSLPILPAGRDFLSQFFTADEVLSFDDRNSEPTDAIKMLWYDQFMKDRKAGKKTPGQLRWPTEKSSYMEGY